MIKGFEFPTEALNNASSALKECEQYCSRKESCQACDIYCNKSCQFNAIPECGAHEIWEGLIDGGVSLKPGKSKIPMQFEN